MRRTEVAAPASLTTASNASAASAAVAWASSYAARSRAGSAAIRSVPLRRVARAGETRRGAAAWPCSHAQTCRQTGRRSRTNSARRSRAAALCTSAAHRGASHASRAGMRCVGVGGRAEPSAASFLAAATAELKRRLLEEGMHG